LPAAPIHLHGDANSQIGDLRFPVGSLPNSTTAAVDALPAPAIKCLDASCPSAQQRTALQTVRSVQKQGWINIDIDQLQALRQVSRDAQDVHNGEALECSRAGGTTYYGLMFHQGCSQGNEVEWVQHLPADNRRRGLLCQIERSDT
jgi:hypothetical protein